MPYSHCSTSSSCTELASKKCWWAWQPTTEVVKHLNLVLMRQIVLSHIIHEAFDSPGWTLAVTTAIPARGVLNQCKEDGYEMCLQLSICSLWVVVNLNPAPKSVLNLPFWLRESSASESTSRTSQGKPPVGTSQERHEILVKLPTCRSQSPQAHRLTRPIVWHNLSCSGWPAQEELWSITHQNIQIAVWHWPRGTLLLNRFPAYGWAWRASRKLQRWLYVYG